MRKKILLTFAFCPFLFCLFAQTDSIEGWKKGGIFSVNFSQVSLTNWAAGGQNSVSGNAITSLFAHYKKNNNLWENYFDAGFGALKQGKSGWQKTDDKIDLTSKYGKKFSGDWYYAALLNFKTQMAPGYNYPDDSIMISDFFAPAYLIGALGFDFKPDTNFTIFIAPITGKFTFVNTQTLADAGAFGVEPAVYNEAGQLISQGKKRRSEFGGYVRMFYRRNLMENISFQTKLDLFSNYLHNPQNIDISWEMLFALKVNKYFSANISTHLLYDDDIDIGIDKNNDGIIDEAAPRTQFKEVFAVGVSYNF